MFFGCQVPGLFEGDEYTTLMTQCKEGSQREGLMLDSSEELYKWFTQQVCARTCLFVPALSQIANVRGAEILFESCGVLRQIVSSGSTFCNIFNFFFP